jgi:hypothetical protein
VERVKKKAKREKTSKQIATEMSEEVKGGISTRSIRRYLKDAGQQYLVKENREELTPEQEARRLEFAQAYKDYNWDSCLFVDEKSWQLGASESRKCWQDSSRPRVVTYKKRHAPKIHCWGGIGKHFKARLYFFKQNLNSDLYCKILKSRLSNVQKYRAAKRKPVLVQDNDPKHRSIKTTELLEKLAPNRIKDYPVNSPDFNPLENIWAILQNSISQKKITNIPALRRHLTEAWKNLDMEVVARCVESLPDRLQECIDRNGKRTDY